MPVRYCTGCGYVAGTSPYGPPEACNDGGLVGPHKFVDAPEDQTHCGASHPLADAIAYIVVATKTGAGRVRDIGVYGPSAYGDAAAALRACRLDPVSDSNYARVDILYRDGCRGIL